jgi:glycosyltransferase involved in cell wall biosynthesis
VAPAHECVIYSPVTLPKSEPIVLPPSADYLLYAGTVVPQKGVCVLAEAARSVLAEFPSTHLVFAGRIPGDQAEIADTLRTLAGPEAASRLHFVGVLDRASLADHMRRARAFVFPSLLESFGLVTAEAMLAGAPVVACDCGPNPEFIRHGENGMLVPPNDPEALAVTLRLLLQNQELASRLAAEGRRTVEQSFSLERCVTESEAFYRELYKSFTR